MDGHWFFVIAMGANLAAFGYILYFTWWTQNRMPGLMIRSIFGGSKNYDEKGKPIKP